MADGKAIMKVMINPKKTLPKLTVKFFIKIPLLNSVYAVSATVIGLGII